MMDLIKDLKEISNKCINYGDCWASSKCPMHLTNNNNPNKTRCAFKLLMYMLSKSTPNTWKVLLEEVDEILVEGDSKNV